MEDYEKKYKDALAKAREIHRNEAEKRFDMEWLFPELRESEDERVKKRILLSLEKDLMATKNSGCDTQDLEQCIAWLENQGETFTKKDVDDAYLKGISDAKNELDKQGEQKPILDFKASNFYVSKVDGKIHDITYNPANKVEPRFKVKYAGSEYNVLEVKDIAGVTFYGIEDEPNHIDYVKAENCEIISGYAIKENGSPYPTKPAAWSKDDEAMFQSCTGAIWAADYYLYEDKQDMEAWLKSIKNRIGG